MKVARLITYVSALTLALVLSAPYSGSAEEPEEGACYGCEYTRSPGGWYIISAECVAAGYGETGHRACYEGEGSQGPECTWGPSQECSGCGIPGCGSESMSADGTSVRERAVGESPTTLASNDRSEAGCPLEWTPPPMSKTDDAIYRKLTAELTF